MQQDGQRFFYVNPLEVLPEACGRDHAKGHVQFQRQPWFGCACCPPNLVRLLMSLEDYLYSVSGSRVYIHLYLSGEAEFRLPGGTLRLDCRTAYPWDGKIRYLLHTDTPLRAELALRLPAWSPRFTLHVNGEKAAYHAEKGYLSRP